MTLRSFIALSFAFWTLFVWRPSSSHALEAVRALEGPSGHSHDELAYLISSYLPSHPAVEAARADVAAAEGRLIQAGLLPNPELAVDLENFAGTGEFSGFDGVESTFGLQQRLPLGGKLTARKRKAALELELARNRLRLTRIRVAAEMEAAFLSLAAAERSHSLAQEMLDLARKATEVVEAKVNAGQVPPMALSKAKVLETSAKIEERRRQADLDAARARLSSALGMSDRQIVDLPICPEPFTSDEVDRGRLPDLIAALEQGPYLRQFQLEAERARADEALIASEAVPDLTLSMGVRHFEETGDKAFIAGITVPLPIFDRRQGDLAAARQRISSKTMQQRNQHLLAVQRLRTLFERLLGSQEEIMALRSSVIPEAERSLEAALEGYRYGKFGYLEVIDAQRTLFSARIQEFDAIGEYHRARAELMVLTGGALPAEGWVEGGER